MNLLMIFIGAAILALFFTVVIWIVRDMRKDKELIKKFKKK